MGRDCPLFQMYWQEGSMGGVRQYQGRTRKSCQPVWMRESDEGSQTQKVAFTPGGQQVVSSCLKWTCQYLSSVRQTTGLPNTDKPN